MAIVADKTTPLLLRKHAAAKRIGINVVYFKRLVNSGMIPYVTIWGCREKLYPVDALDAYVASLERCKMGDSENQLVALKGAK